MGSRYTGFDGEGKEKLIERYENAPNFFKFQSIYKRKMADKAEVRALADQYSVSPARIRDIVDKYQQYLNAKDRQLKKEGNRDA